MSIIESDCFQLPCEKLVGLATDGASVLLPPRNGVVGLVWRKLGCSHNTVVLD